MTSQTVHRPGTSLDTTHKACAPESQMSTILYSFMDLSTKTCWETLFCSCMCTWLVCPFFILKWQQWRDSEQQLCDGVPSNHLHPERTLQDHGKLCLNASCYTLSVFARTTKYCIIFDTQTKASIINIIKTFSFIFDHQNYIFKVFFFLKNV